MERLKPLLAEGSIMEFWYPFCSKKYFIREQKVTLRKKSHKKLLYGFLRRLAPRFCIGSLALPQQNFADAQNDLLNLMFVRTHR